MLTNKPKIISIDRPPTFSRYWTETCVTLFLELYLSPVHSNFFCFHCPGSNLFKALWWLWKPIIIGNIVTVYHQTLLWLDFWGYKANLIEIKLFNIPYLFDYKPISAISRDPKLWTCRLGITRTKNKSKTPGYKPRPIHYYKTELVTTGKPNIFGKKSHWLS